MERLGMFRVKFTVWTLNRLKRLFSRLFSWLFFLLSMFHMRFTQTCPLTGRMRCRNDQMIYSKFCFVQIYKSNLGDGIVRQRWASDALNVSMDVTDESSVRMSMKMSLRISLKWTKWRLWSRTLCGMWSVWAEDELWRWRCWKMVEKREMAVEENAEVNEENEENEDVRSRSFQAKLSLAERSNL